mmetsp:Transcript_1042/g.1904  ORF Transcript_1042/g.1904 Transcript_1042/m.1904 type:complete len:329 (+) Transcript_1042:599-1585(+)
MGFDAFFFARLDYADKERRMNELEMEYIWRPNPLSLGNQTQIFTHVLYAHYSSPSGFNFDILDGDDPWINNAQSEDFNAAKEAKKMAGEIEERLQHYLTDDLFMVFGDDFRYMNAFQNYHNMDGMISYMNEHYGDKYLFKYSTPSDYIDALQKYQVQWPTKYDDMFPYSDSPDAYWTGYFSSRANDKAFTRKGSSVFHAQSQLLSEAVLDANKSKEQIGQILEAKEDFLDAMGINQHHDAITGTAKQRVADDYAFRISRAIKSSSDLYSSLIENKINLLSGLASDQKWVQCERTNSTFLDCPISEFSHELQNGFQMTVVVHNPSSLDL